MVRSLKFIVFLNLLFAFANVYGQKTQVYIDPHEVYENGVDLFNKKQYGASNETFERFLDMPSNEPLLIEKAKLYMLLNDVKLDRRNSHSELAKYLRSEQESNMTNLATFTLACYYFDHEKYRQEKQHKLIAAFSCLEQF